MGLPIGLGLAWLAFDAIFKEVAHQRQPVADDLRRIEGGREAPTFSNKSPFLEQRFPRKILKLGFEPMTLESSVLMIYQYTHSMQKLCNL